MHHFRSIECLNGESLIPCPEVGIKNRVKIIRIHDQKVQGECVVIEERYLLFFFKGKSVSRGDL